MTGELEGKGTGRQGNGKAGEWMTGELDAVGGGKRVLKESGDKSHALHRVGIWVGRSERPLL
jgi:hypothetical protein